MRAVGGGEGLSEGGNRRHQGGGKKEKEWEEDEEEQEATEKNEDQIRRIAREERGRRREEVWWWRRWLKEEEAEGEDEGQNCRMGSRETNTASSPVQRAMHGRVFSAALCALLCVVSGLLAFFFLCMQIEPGVM